MVKTAIKLPAGFECDDGTCLEKPISFKVDIPEISPSVRMIPNAQVGENATGTNQVMAKQEEKPIEKTIEVVKKVVPSWQPNFICKGPNCNTKKNPAYSQRPKGKCSNCGQFSKEAFGSCIWCDNKEFEELDEEELDNLGVPRVEEKEPDLDQEVD